ncbi:DMT family transporter [Pseudomonas moorei]|uniref:Transporter family-2 protein n=1 Tax=Pseudomonas moorei TaxID=395599 RepID=A0A1H0YMP8_9PSED|nr:DMT family transporter [Pseudomonas moorei]KAB0502377.1 DMT family transporter [Pseudomonas moorei]SDQ16398.1 transporter family-2 protein [Pseudomonas moorei]
MSTLHGVGLLLLAVIAGAVVPFQSAINANLGRGLGHPLWATLASLLVSILVLLPIMLALRVPLPSMAFISRAPLWMWAGGAFGVCFISLALVLLPKLGASGFMALALAGQVVASLVLDHFGWFGLVQRQVSLPRVLGVVMLIAGVILIQFSGAHDKALATVG